MAGGGPRAGPRAEEPADRDEAGPRSAVARGIERGRGDPDQLRRLLGNLVKNAVEASAARAGTIQARLTAREGRVELLLADRGTGLAGPLAGAEMLRALGSSKPGGSGLGLPIAHKIAHDPGGRLRLLPREGGGCEARLELPGPLPLAPALEQGLT